MCLRHIAAVVELVGCMVVHCSTACYSLAMRSVAVAWWLIAALVLLAGWVATLWWRRV
ncbi:MAG: hypothetical protein SOU27_10165 [Sodaliphilus sp.]|nr:hypothetical protein [Sodaliphilus sp.]